MQDARGVRSALVIAGSAMAAAVFALGVAAGRQAGSVPQEEYQDPTAHPTYYRSGEMLPGYRFTELPLDPDSPFYPSSANTRSGGFYSQAQLMDVERCGDAGCHPDIYDMWFESTHHLASMSDPWYRRSVQFIQERAGVRTSQWCAGCHDPALMMTGVMQREEPIDMGGAAANIGISCQFCHSVDRIHPAHANGSYRLAPAAALPFAGTDDPQLRAEGNRMLLADPKLIRRHKGRRRSSFHALAEFCATCHKQSLVTPVNNYKWLRGFDEYDGWQDSGVSGGSARAFYYPERPLRCQDCHMPEVPSNDAGNDGGYVNSHRFLGSNTALSALHGYTEQLRATVSFLQNRRLSVDPFALRLSDAAGRQLLLAPADAGAVALAAGSEAELEVVVRTRGIGHPFTGGTTDSNMAWLEVTMLDARGEVLAMSGGMGEDRFVDPAAHFYRGIFLDEAGQEIHKRNGWDRRAAVYVRAIPPGAADTVHYRFRVPEDAAGPLRLRARVVYRKHRQAYHRWVFGAVAAAEQPPGAVSTPAVDTRVWEYDDARVPEIPAVVLAEGSLRIDVLPPAAVPTLDGRPLRQAPEPRAEQWERFNDYAIGLLLQGDFRGALRAFRVVQRLRPEDPDAWVNEARVHLREGNLGDAQAALDRAFALRPGYAKAAYFAAQVARGLGEYARAAELLERVLEQFPYDRRARIDLGNTYYLMGEYERAVEPLLFVIDEIDPEELGAHYNLMLAYRAMGQLDRARVHEERYRRYRDDEDIRRLTGPYRRAHAEANNEAQAIHRHTLGPPDGRFSAPERFPWTEWLEGGRYGRDRVVYPGPTPPWQRPDRARTATR